MEIMTWLLGSLEDRSFEHLWIALPCVTIGAALLLWDRSALDALTLGEDGARSLGVRLGAVRLRLLLGIGIGVGGAVAVSGAIRSEERRVGKEWCSTGRSRWSPDH